MRRRFLIWMLLCCTIGVQGQDLNFSQFYEMPMLRNPALAGFYKGDLRFTSIYRNQWEAVPVKYQTQGAGVETKFAVSGDDYMSLGMQMTNDRAGDGRLGRTQILPVAAFHKSLNADRDMYLTAGFIGGPVSQRVDPTRLRFDDQFVNGAYSASNPTRQTFSTTNFTYFDLGAGLSLSSEIGLGNRFYIGASYLHFNNPKVAFSALNDIRLNRKFMLNGGLSLAMSDMDQLTFFGDLFFQGGSKQMQGGVILKHTFEEYENEESVGFSIGSFYRGNDAVIPMMKLDVMKWGIGVSYDVNVSQLKTASQFRGGLEVSVSYKTYLNIMNSSLNHTRCITPFW